MYVVRYCFARNVQEVHLLEGIKVKQKREKKKIKSVILPRFRGNSVNSNVLEGFGRALSL